MAAKQPEFHQDRDGKWRDHQNRLVHPWTVRLARLGLSYRALGEQLTSDPQQVSYEAGRVRQYMDGAVTRLYPDEARKLSGFLDAREADAANQIRVG